MDSKTAALNCTHHWRIESPNGPTCRATCLSCGAEREFNTAAENQWVTRSEVESNAA
jgi:RNase P subunit RPR2